MADKKLELKTFYQEYPIQRLDVRVNTESTSRRDDWVNWGQGGMNDYPQFVRIKRTITHLVRLY